MCVVRDMERESRECRSVKERGMKVNIEKQAAMATGVRGEVLLKLY